jgi:hypothetical protein
LNPGPLDPQWSQPWIRGSQLGSAVMLRLGRCPWLYHLVYVGVPAIAPGLAPSVKWPTRRLHGCAMPSCSMGPHKQITGVSCRNRNVSSNRQLDGSPNPQSGRGHRRPGKSPLGRGGDIVLTRVAWKRLHRERGADGRGHQNATHPGGGACQEGQGRTERRRIRTRPRNGPRGAERRDLASEEEKADPSQMRILFEWLRHRRIRTWR